MIISNKTQISLTESNHSIAN